MRFSSIQIKGKGRGKLLGFPTINLGIPKNFELTEGIYAVKVHCAGKEFIGALHFGPVPVFSENKKTLEVFLINTSDSNIPDSHEFEIEVLKFIRPVLNFPNKEALIMQITGDVGKIKKILKH